ncbi:heptaprenyl diphosphate synthase component 1 [Fictibacillus nanhaiensis]|uniref:heptaprenyl diphosphate synthase component 1 n=1 Tax=Fictibacillus nanhaiensis TaxID=742169 RepID=UPI001C97B33E|nr:heptaprenyl diphosphate synthase component 1 [Fictibacillus nanhaiensis]MBY6035688.1 heptaprenyl diphosphate synthase component 1 [Fictibacillus nanhaiensis]
MNTMEQIQRLKQHTLLLMQHRYVDEFLLHPVLHDAKVFITYGLLRELELDEAVEAEYFGSILLIQSALDRHDDILEPNMIAHKKKRQLVVLSGDYFSSLYYLLLSRCENLDLISHLSTAVQKINEHKTYLHLNIKNRSSMEYLKSVEQMESLLYTKAAESFGLHKYIPFIERYLLIARYQSKESRSVLNKKQLNSIKKFECDIREKKVDVPFLFTREESTMYDCFENDLLLGEG